MSKLTEKFEHLRYRLKSDGLEANHGLSGEVPYFILDYNAQDELYVRDEVNQIVNGGPYGDRHMNIKLFNLFEIMMDTLTAFNYTEIIYQFEKEQGMDFVIEQINNLMNTNEENNRFVEYIKSQVNPDEDIIFIVGIGQIFPLIRTHKILNTMTQVIDYMPVVLFYPGKFDNIKLSMFGELNDDNYYRATQIN